MLSFAQKILIVFGDAGHAEFNDIMPAAEMDADVISIETSRSDMELLNAFRDFRYPNEIGPGASASTPNPFASSGRVDERFRVRR